MKFSVGDPLTILCDRCGQGGIDANSVVGVAVGEVRIMHPRCATESHGFMTNGAARVLTPSELSSELTTALGA